MTEPADQGDDASDRVGGDETGFSVVLPDHWVAFDANADDLVAQAEEAGLHAEVPVESMAADVAGDAGAFTVELA